MATPAPPIPNSPELDPADPQASEERPRKRFRWGCFFLANLLSAAVVLLLLLLFWPVPESDAPVVEQEKRAITEGGAVIKATALEDIGSPHWSGPGNDRYTQILIQADITNTTDKEHLLDIQTFKFSDGYRKDNKPDPGLTRTWMRTAGMEDPWDAPILPGETKKVAVVFVTFDVPKQRRVLVRRGFDWTSDDYYPLPLPTDRKKRIFVEKDAPREESTEVQDVGDNVNLIPKSELK